MPFGPAWVCWTGRTEGDLGRTASAEQRAAVYDGPWASLRQVHGATVRVVADSSSAAPAVGDALLSTRRGVALAVVTADCAPVALVSDNDVIAIAHGGWRGLREGVLRATVAAMRARGGEHIEAILGPCIRPCCYEFGAADLADMVRAFGASVATDAGALDLPAVVRADLHRLGINLEEHGACTSCSPGWFSHRARAETERQASLVMLA